MEGIGNIIYDSDEQFTQDFIHVEQFLNRVFNHMNVRTLNPSLIDNVMDRSFREQKVQQYSASEEFIQGLDKVQIQEGDEYSCGICLEEFKVGETVLKYPCKDILIIFILKKIKKIKRIKRIKKIKEKNYVMGFYLG